MNNIQCIVETLNKMQPLEIVESPIVRDKFISIWETLWGEGTGEAAYERESYYFNSLMREVDGGRLMNATKFSIFNSFVDLAISGLSLEPGVRALAYLTGRNVNLGTKERPSWEGRMKLTISGYGELVMRARCGQIRHADNPVLVYANDEFSFSDCNGRKEINYKCNLPHTGHPIVACYLRITRADGSIDYSIMLEEDWVRLAGYSARQNKNNTANALYGVDQHGYVHIDPGFLAAKCIKHAFKTYPKVRIGRGTELQSDDDGRRDEIDELYNMGESHAPANEETFAPKSEPAAGVTVTTDDDGAF